MLLTGVDEGNLILVYTVYKQYSVETVDALESLLTAVEFDNLLEHVSGPG